MVNNLGETNSIANKFVAQLRDVNVQKDSLRFRRNLERLGEIIAYEISKTLKYETKEVETPLGIAKIKLPAQPIVLATILRAGLPFHQGFLNYFDDAGNAFISAYRKHHKDGTFEIEMGYTSCPDLNGAVVIVTDPMLATGASMNLALEELRGNGQPAKIHVVTAIASRQGLDYLKRNNPNVHIWMGAIDEELTAKSYIVPGLGDAGDLAFGPKMQE
ncbi:MAG: uracil phosphoribosyltransferase [Saprospiraceae bacterium]|jgi:uracil phosphoribosyltransferase